MNEGALAAIVAIPALTALLIAALALLRTSSDANALRKEREVSALDEKKERETAELKSLIATLKDEIVSLKSDIKGLNAQVSQLTNELASANLKLLRQLLKDNGVQGAGGGGNA